MKMTRKILALILALVMVMGLASVASATVVNDTDHDYLAYQIFTGTQNATDPELANVDWGTGINGAAFLADLKADSVVGTLFAGANNADDVATILSKNNTNSALVGQFAQLAYNNISSAGTPVPANGEPAGLDAGYYLIVDITEVGEGDAKNPALLQVTNAGTVHIQMKYDVPVPDKNILADDPGDTNDHVDFEDAGLGKTVEFHLKATLPTILNGYEKYKMVFHDDLSDGLTFVEDSVEVWVNGTKVTADYSVNHDDCDKDDDTPGGHDCDFHVVIPDVFAYTGIYAAGCDVIVKYKAVVNKEAFIIDAANPNDFRLEYSNDPNWDPDIPENEGKEPPTGVTPWDEVNVYNTEVEILKADGATDQPLQGAKFKLEGHGKGYVRVRKHEFVAYGASEPVDESNKYWKLTDDTFTTMDPTLAGIDQSKYASLTELYKAVDSDEFIGNESTETVIEVTVGPDGVVKFGGLGEGTYTITELEAPGGYNGLENPITLTITFNETDGTFTYSWSDGASLSHSGKQLQIDNYKGQVLPETGGMGTTLFYVIGTVMVLGSAVLLVTKKRMTAE